MELRWTEWTLGLRWRYALVWGGLNFLVVFGLVALFSSLNVANLWRTAIAALVIGFAAHAFIWYPRAKAKATPRQPV